MATPATRVVFKSSKQLGAWLSRKERDVSVALAVRASLRVLPLVLGSEGWLQGQPDLLRATIQIIRVNFVNWAAAAETTHTPRLRPSDIAGEVDKLINSVYSERADLFVGNAAVLAANVTNAVNFVSMSTQAIAAAVEAARHAHPEGVYDLWGSVAADADWFQRSKSPSELLRQPLWLADVRSKLTYKANFPDWAREPFDKFDRHEWVVHGPWGVWLAWYRELLAHSSSRRLFNENRTLEIASMEDSFWGDDPHRITASVAAIAHWKWDQSQWAWLDEAETTEEVGNGKSKRATKKTPRQAKTSRKTTRPLSSSDSGSQAVSEAVRIHSDEPAEVDQLNRWPFGKALVEHMDEVYSQRGPDGFAVHIHAPWGAGKTTVIRMMRQMLEQTDRTSKGGRPAPQWVVVEFNAWKNERRNPPWWPLVQEVKTECLKASKAYAAMRLWLYWFWWTVRANWLPYVVSALVVAVSSIVLWYTWNSTGLQALVETTLKLITAAAAICVSFVGASRIAVFGSSANAKFYEDLSQDPLERILRLFVKVVESTKKPICIIVDDLDRCRPEYVVNLLQGIQTTFRHPSVAYVVPADRHWIKASFENQYGTMAAGLGNPGQPLGYLFLEKVFQISTPLPGISAKTRAQFWEYLLKRADNKVGNASASSSTSMLSERSVEEKRETLRTQEPNLTRARADELLKSNDSPEDRAAIVLELSASPAAKAETTHLLSRFKDVVSDIPRMMKRTINAFAVRQAIGALEDNAVPAMALARWTILEQRYPALADLLTEHPDWLSHLRVKMKGKLPEEVRATLAPFLNSEEIIGILGASKDSPLTAEVVRTITHGSVV